MNRLEMESRNQVKELPRAEIIKFARWHLVDGFRSYQVSKMVMQKFGLKSRVVALELVDAASAA